MCGVRSEPAFCFPYRLDTLEELIERVEHRGQLGRGLGHHDGSKIIRATLGNASAQFLERRHPLPHGPPGGKSKKGQSGSHGPQRTA